MKIKRVAWLHLAVVTFIAGCAREDKEAAPKAKAAPLKTEIMFVLDVTGSSGTTDFARHGIRPFMERLTADGIDARVGLTIFRDEKPMGGEIAGAKDDPWSYTFRDGEHYTANADEFRDLVSRIPEGGGGDGPENALEALRLASDQKGRPGAVLVHILMTDGEPKPWPKFHENLQRTRQHLMDRGVRQLHLITPGRFKDIYARLWDGTIVKTPSGTDIERLSGNHHEDQGLLSDAPKYLTAIARDIRAGLRREAGEKD